MLDRGIKRPLPPPKGIHTQVRACTHPIIAQSCIQNTTTFDKLPATSSLNSDALEKVSDNGLAHKLVIPIFPLSKPKT